MFRQTTAVLVLGLIATVSSLQGQTSQKFASNSRSRLGTSYFSGNRGAFSYGNYTNYGTAWGGARMPLQPNPLGAVAPTLPPVTGNVEKYSNVEYGDIVRMAIEAARKNNPGGSGQTVRRSIVDETTGTASQQAGYAPVATKISDVLDRGIILLPTGEELRLRGVIIPSSSDTNDVSRLYAREAIQSLRTLSEGKEIYAVLDDPIRDSNGRILGTLLLADGTELNRRMLELGYGSLKAEDFAAGVDYSDLSAAQDFARTNRVGIWSKGY